MRFWKKQRELALLIQNSDRVAVAAGHKVSKTYTLAIAILWYFCTWPDAAVYVTAPSFEQVKDPLWKTISHLFRRSGVCLACRDKGVKDPCVHSAKLDGTLNVSPMTGLVCGERTIIGLAPQNPNNLSGKSSPHIMWVCDEVIGIESEIIEAIMGTMAGGAKLAIAANPTENDPNNEFCQAFGKKKDLYDTMHISSLDSPNITGEMHVPGLCVQAWVDEKKLDWGEDSPVYQSRVLGQFSTRGTNGLLSQHDIRKAQIRWESMEGEGLLVFGLDLASASTGNDKTTVAIRRGNKVLVLDRFEGFDTQETLDKCVELIRTYRQGDEVVSINYDNLNNIGKAFGDAINRYCRMYPNTVAPRGLSGNADPPNNRFGRLRDYAIWNMCEALKKAVGIPQDEPLEEELLTIRWDIQASEKYGRDKVIAKKELRKELGRSTDISDALAYCLFDLDRDSIPRLFKPQEPQQRAPQIHNPFSKSYNPYAGNALYSRKT